jgi:hypothetical protein
MLSANFFAAILAHEVLRQSLGTARKFKISPAFLGFLSADSATFSVERAISFFVLLVFQALCLWDCGCGTS